MQKKLVLLFYLTTQFLTVLGKNLTTDDINVAFELSFFAIAQNSLEGIDTLDSDLNIPDNSEYYTDVIASIIAFKRKEFDKFDSLVSRLTGRDSTLALYDTIGYVHYLQYKQFYRLRMHREAMEQLIYAKETFKRNRLFVMNLECISQYYANYANSIFGNLKVDDLNHIEKEVEGKRYRLDDSDLRSFWVKLMIYDKLGALRSLDGELEKSGYYLQYVIDQAKDKKIDRVYYNAVGNISINQFKDRQYEKSIENALIDLESSLRSGRDFSCAGLGVLLAKNYIGLKQPTKARDYIVMADSFSVRLNGIFRADILETKAEYNRLIGNTSKSNDYFQQYLAQKDSINLNAIREMEFRMSTEQDFYQKIMAYEAENLKNQSIIRSQRLQAFLIISILMSILMITGIIALMLQNIRRKNAVLSRQKSEILEANEELQAQKEELKTQNETITELNYSLEKKVLERTHDLEEKTRVIEAFLYQMSHRFRTPIANLKGLINLIGIEPQDEAIPKYLDLSRDSINRLDGLLAHIKQLLEFEKVNKDREVLNLNELAQEVIEELKNEYKNISIFNHLPSNEMPMIFAVREYITVMLWEILDNSCKFSQQNDAAAIVSINYTLKENNINIVIEDNGPGITKEHWERIFEPFYIGNESSKGEGLGIYIATIAANKTGCKIQHDASLENGTRMIIVIPTESRHA